MIFISYRRSDTADFSRRLAHALRAEFGAEQVFLDDQWIEPGTPWPKEIKQALNRSTAFILVIGEQWLHASDPESGRRRIDLEHDWVRQEILGFLKTTVQSPTLFVPLLIDGARMPPARHLDGELSCICSYQALHAQDTGKPSDFFEIRQRLIHFGFQSVEPPAVVTPIIGQKPKRLNSEEEEEFLRSYPEWRLIESEKPGHIGEIMRELYRVYEFRNFDMAWQFMMRVVDEAIRPNNHHPRWRNTWNRVEVWLCTFNIGHKPSERDLKLGGLIEGIWEERDRSR